ncbi:MAG: zinc-finger domain-containing protein [Alphaproteobacteria bacterium]
MSSSAEQTNSAGTAPETPETIETDQHRVACNGGGGALGHPKVFLEMGDDHQVTCPYCGRLYKLAH